PVLALTTFDEDEVLWGAIEAGVTGFVLKYAGAADLIAAVTAVARGGAWFDRSVTPRILAAYRRNVAPRQREYRMLARQTEREHSVLRRVARRATNAEVSQTLHVSEAKGKAHVSSVFIKLGVRERAGAIVFACDHGVAAACGT